MSVWIQDDTEEREQRHGYVDLTAPKGNQTQRSTDAPKQWEFPLKRFIGIDARMNER